MNAEERIQYVSSDAYLSLKEEASIKAMDAVEKISGAAPDMNIAIHLSIDAALNVLGNLIWNLREFGLDAEAVAIAHESSRQLIILAEKIKKEAA